MKTSELIAAIMTNPSDAEWELFSDFGPHVERTEECGCVIAWSFTDEIYSSVPKCDGTCVQYDDERGAGCMKCAHLCQPFREPTEEEAGTYEL